ncbi:MAG: hypothetical protein JSS09_02355 [Verrucomicrobia bacterium]|nr:hypothetical protein [Verrucomicrobiota bacterium]
MDSISVTLPAAAFHQEIQDRVTEIYKQAVAEGKCSYGPFGDYIQATVVRTPEETIVTVNQIAHKAFIKPAVATDICLFIRGVHVLPSGKKEKKIYGIFINRLNPPGKGKAATIGGFNNIEVNKDGIEFMDSPIRTALSEGVEEAGFEVHLNKGKLRDVNVRQIQGTIVLGKKGSENRPKFDCNVEYVGHVSTSNKLMKDGGEVIEGSGGQKRVHIAHAVLTTVEAPKGMNLSQELVEGWFTAGDDASKVIVCDVTSEIKGSSTKQAANELATRFFQAQEMGIEHHKDILALCFERANQVFHPKSFWDSFVPSIF